MIVTVIKIDNLVKKYGNQTILENINVLIKKGEIVGLVGSNGCGKTTLMKMILGLTPATSGEIVIDNNIKFGYLLDCKMFEFLTAYENLKLFAKYSGVIEGQKLHERIIWLLNFVGLENNNKKVKSYSFGMKQRLGLSLALLERPNFLILDEPFVGLDPVGTKQLIEYIKKIRDELKMTVLISSHQLGEIEELCDYFLTIQSGKMNMSKSIRKSQLLITIANLGQEKRQLFHEYKFEKMNTIIVENQSNLLNILLKKIYENQLSISCIEEKKYL